MSDSVPETDADALRSAYDALNRNDLSQVFALIAPDIDWHDQATMPDGPGRGRESFEQYLHSWLESFDEFRIDPEEVFEHREQLIAIVRQPVEEGSAAPRSRYGSPTFGPSKTTARSGGEATPTGNRRSRRMTQPRIRLLERLHGADHRRCGRWCPRQAPEV